MVTIDTNESTTRVGIYMPARLWRRLRTVAVERGVSASKLAEEAILAKLASLDRDQNRKQRTA